MLRQKFGQLCAIVVISLLANAQLPTSTLNGTVTDPQGAVVAGAKVTTTNLGTSVARTSNTDAQGFYSFTNLPAGDYSLRIQSPSFAAAEVKDVRLEVGKASTVDAKLSMAKAGEVVTVTGNEAAIELTQSEVQGQITSETVENIPLNGRNFLELAYLIPGNRPATNFDPTKTNTLEVSSAGAFGRGGNLTIDGGDNNDEVVGGTLMNLPEDSVKEFQIATNRFTAEVGRSGSSIINIITKSGTNHYHGSAFFFFRHKVLQGLPATFDRRQPTPRFVREQTGGSIGGPIVKDKAWWFVSSEYRNQNHAVPVGFRNFAANTVIPGAAPAFVHDYLLSSRADWKVSNQDNVFVRYSFNRSLDIDNGSLRKAEGTAANRQSSLNRFNSWQADWSRLISSRLVNDASFHIDYFLNSIPSFSPDNPVTNPTGLAPGNEIRFPSLQDGANFRIPQSTKFNRYQIHDTLSWVAGNHTLRFGGEWQHLSTFALFDLFGSGSIFTTEDFASQDRNGDGVINDLDLPIAIALKSAAPVRPPIVPFYGDHYFGTFVQDDWKAFPNLTLNLGLRWEYDDVVGDLSAVHPCASLTAVDLRCEYVNNLLGNHKGPGLNQFAPRVGFAWDPFKQGHTVIRGGYGIYYDRVVTEVPLLPLLLNGRILPLASFSGSTCVVPGTATVESCSNAGAVFPTVGGVVATPTLANPFSGAPATFGAGINYINPNARHPYVQQFTVGVQQEIARNWIVSADGIHDFGVHSILGRFLRTTSSTNSAIDCPNGFTPCQVVDPSTGQSNASLCFTPASPSSCNSVTDIESVAKSWYDALLFSLQKRPTGSNKLKWGFNANYTLSKTLNFSNDDQIPFNGEEDAVNLIFKSNNLRLEKSYSPTDERHRFVFYGLFDFPWQISVAPIWTWSSHVPMDSLVPGLSSRLPILARNALGREIQTGAQLNAAIALWNSLPSCTGLNQVPCNPDPNPPGSALRNNLSPVNPNIRFGDDFNSLDMRFTKTWTFTETQNLQFITEVFNVGNITNIRGFNNNNYAGFNNDITSTRFNQPLNVAGKFFGSGGPRAFQFALRYAF